MQFLTTSLELWGTYHCRESTEESIPEVTQCEGKVFIEEILEEVAHAQI